MASAASEARQTPPAARPGAPAPPQRPQPPTAPAQSSPGFIHEQTDARETQERLRDVLNQYPPSVREVLRIDPTLLYRPDYLATYPMLASFLEQHPEIAHNPGYFLGEWRPREDQTPTSEGFRTLDRMSENLMVLLIIITITSGVIWLVRTAIEHRRWQRAMRAQTELNTKLIDRFSTSEELLSYLQSPAGKALIEPAALPQAASRPMPMNAPLSRIFWSLQSGIVVGALGTGLMIVAGNVSNVRGARVAARLRHRPAADWCRLCHLSSRVFLPVSTPRPRAVHVDPVQRRGARGMTRRLLSYAFPFMDSLDPLAQAPETTARDATLQMDEETFRGFYTRTSGMLWAYLARATNDAAAADDLLQESYYRLLRATTTFESDDHRKNYLFRIATNLIRDRFRRPRIDNAQLPEHGEGDIPASGDLAQQTQQRSDLARAMAQLSQRERELVLLAYGQGSTHQEIAGALGLRTGSIKPLLFRARRKLARILAS